MSRRWRPGSVTLVIGAVIVLLSVGGYFLLQHSVDQQETALLSSNTTDAGADASSLFGSITSGLSSDAAVVKLTNANPTAFVNFVNPSGKSTAGDANVLVRKEGAGYVVVASSGSSYKPGQILTGPALATVRSAAGTGVTSGPVTSNGKVSYARFAVPVSGGLAVYEEFMIPVHLNIATVIGNAFNNLNVALYGPGPPSSSNLLIASTNALPLAKPAARTTVHIGASRWTLIANARSPYVSGLASSGPWILLVMGLLIALVVMITIETVQRRQRYAQSLVTERTADLNSSLSELKETQDALVRQERLSAVGEMASVIGHELRNPLAAVTNALFIVQGDLGQELSPTTEKYLSMAERETSKAAVLADDLTAFVRPRELVESEIDVPGLVEEVLSATPQPDDVRIDLEVAPCSLVGDRGQLAEVLTNLVTNAYQAMPDGGTVRLGAFCSNGSATFTVEDSGSGIKDTTMQRVFEPFFTTKDSGTGLGLAIVQRLVQAHGGQISLENAASGGVRATVVLPVKHKVAG
ncbi:MAG TPA: ATP-binding protein [Acidimicrobiales bacterium]|jgi:signal transduction histidine kinase|nr:ATP-binding protein [Acidimicrobiales bacterium]